MFRIFCLGIVASICLSCSNSGLSTSSTLTSNSLTSTADNLETMSQGFTPDSLAYNSGNNSVIRASTNPCEGFDLFTCQPVLLRLYYSMALQFLDIAKGIVNDAGTELGTLADGSGTRTEGSYSYSYTKSGANFSVLRVINSEPQFYLSVQDTTIVLKLDLASIEEAQGQAGKFEVNASYTDENNWTMSVFISGMGCEDNDPRAPEKIKISIVKASGLWTGKAMMYNGRWRGDDSLTCDTAATDELSMNIYTDFVGNDVAAKAKVYFAGRAVSDFTEDNADTYGFPNICGSLGCDAGVVINPFCNPASDLTADWNSDCAGVDATVQAAPFSSFSNWIAPNEFYEEDITLPSSL